MAEDMNVEEGPEKNHTAVDVQDGKKKGKKSKSCARFILVLLFLAMAGCIIGLAVALAKRGRNEPPKVEERVKSTLLPPTDDEVEVRKSASGSYRFGAVASDHEDCSRVGTEILAKYGGSTMDATIATLLCLGVHHFPSTGLGGGFLMTIYDSKKKEFVTLNSREVAPLFATEDMYVNTTTASTEGGLAVAVPGQIAGYAEAHKRYGKLPWSLLFQSAIRMSDKGFTVNEFLDYVIRGKEKDIRAHNNLGKLLIKHDGTLVKLGDIIKRPLYARTLRRIAKEGPESFYNGSVADDMIKDIQECGGNITIEDLRSYTAVWQTPVSVTLANGGYTLYGPPPPSSAVVMYYILNIMDGYNVSSSDTKTLEAKVLLAHRLVEAMKFGFGKRSYLGDEDFVNVTYWMELLTSNSYATDTRLKINDAKVLTFSEYESAFDIVTDGGTTHLSVIGPDGMAVSVTSTINTYLGCKEIGTRTGIVFNNEMDDFSTPGVVNFYGVRASPSNYIVPGKRPMSSMSPTIVLDNNGQVVLVVGSSGGTRIISGTLQVILNTLWMGYNLTEAIDQPHYHHQLLPDEILHEIYWSSDIRHALAKKGQKFKIRNANFCVTQAIKNECTINQLNKAKNRRCIQAVCDARRNGIPDGY